MAFQIKKKTHSLRNNCALCKSKKLGNILSLSDSRLPNLYLKNPNEKNSFNKIYDFSVYMCRGCGHIQLKTIINPAYTWSDYFFKTSVKMNNNNHYDKYVERIFKFYKKKNSKCFRHRF